MKFALFMARRYLTRGNRNAFIHIIRSLQGMHLPKINHVGIETSQRTFQVFACGLGIG